MKVAIIYSSITGNTKLLDETIKNEIKEEIVYFGKPINEEIDADIYFIGSWTNKGDASNDIINFLKKLKNKKIAYFATTGYGGSTTYYDTLFSRVKQYIDSSDTILGSLYCQGKMPIQINPLPQKILALCQLLRTHPIPIWPPDAENRHRDKSLRLWRCRFYRRLLSILPEWMPIL